MVNINPPYSSPPKPGTYRIISVVAQNNVIEVSVHNQERALCSPWKNEPHQHWILQHSGNGYKIKNVKHGLYLASNGKENAVVGISPEPTIWRLMRTHEGFGIQYGDENRVVDLHRGLDCYGNVLQLWGWAGRGSERWSFEHISDDVGGEVAEIAEDQVKKCRFGTQTPGVLPCNTAWVNPPYACPPTPGTYRIVSVAAQSNVIEVCLHNEKRAACSPWENRPHQQWVVQYSGRGYKIKNVKHGIYLAADSGKMHTVIGASTEPTTWNLMRTHAGFAIQYGDEDSVVDLCYGSDVPCNILQLQKWANIDDRRWSFMHINDDVGEEVADTVEDQVQSLREQLQTQAANHYYEKLASVRDRERQLAEKDRQLAEKDRELQTALQSQLEGQPLALGLIAELRRKIEEFEQLSQATEYGHTEHQIMLDEIV